MRSNFKGFQKSNRSVFNDKCLTDKMREKNCNKHNIHLIRSFADSFESLKQKSQVLPEHSQLCFSFVTITQKNMDKKEKNRMNRRKHSRRFCVKDGKISFFWPCIYGFCIFVVGALMVKTSCISFIASNFPFSFFISIFSLYDSDSYFSCKHFLCPLKYALDSVYGNHHIEIKSKVTCWFAIYYKL